MLKTLNLNESDVLEKRIKIDSLFTQLLNLTFKNFLEGIENECLNNFETSVIFIIKRKELLLNRDFENFLSRAEENDKIMKKLSDEVNSLKIALQKLQTQTDTLNEKINNDQSNIKFFPKKPKRSSKLFCSIC